MTVQRVVFGPGEFSRSMGEHGFHTADAWLPARSLTGLRVNLGTKDGAVYEEVIVIEYGTLGLILEGGRKGWPYQPERAPVPIGREAVRITEIARGFTWAQPPPGGNPS